MKTKEGLRAKCLTRKQLRKIEKREGVLLGEPMNSEICDKQQFSVTKKENELFMGEITSQGKFFTEDELGYLIMELIEPICDDWQ
jgi:hypothetical protein